jgi:hypothetical protein
VAAADTNAVAAGVVVAEAGVLVAIASSVTAAIAISGVTAATANSAANASSAIAGTVISATGAIVTIAAGVAASVTAAFDSLIRFLGPEVPPFFSPSRVQPAHSFDLVQKFPCFLNFPSSRSIGRAVSFWSSPSSLH